ncbi:MAG: pectinesterase family protein [Bacteroides fragilis]|nr:pectinesterase family protein [Bacteroides fragilis]
MERYKKIYVSSEKGARADFTSVADAIAGIPKDNQEPVTVLIAPGVYHEKITVDRPFVTLEGTGENGGDTVLTFDDYANLIMENGEKMGTFRSYSVFVDAPDVTLKNLTIENASGDSRTHGQAIALYADGDRLTVDSCRLLGHQDTLFTGPLPPKEAQKNGFIGPKQFAPRTRTRQYYKNCYICGDVDFIFGGAAAYFENCTIESLRRFMEESDAPQGYVTAASTPEGQEYGYVFAGCRLISGDCPQGTVYLGRPWRNYARTVFIGCSLGEHIHPALFHDWNKPDARETILYGVCQKNFREAFPERAEFVQEITEEQLGSYTKEKVLG